MRIVRLLSGPSVPRRGEPIAQTLAYAGHGVIEAEDGATAILALSNDAETIDAVVLDFPIRVI